MCAMNLADLTPTPYTKIEPHMTYGSLDIEFDPYLTFDPSDHQTKFAMNLVDLIPTHVPSFNQIRCPTAKRIAGQTDRQTDRHSPLF